MYFSHFYNVNVIDGEIQGSDKIAELLSTDPLDANYFHLAEKIDEGPNAIGLLILPDGTSKIIYQVGFEHSIEFDWRIMRLGFIEAISTIAERHEKVGDAEILDCHLCDCRYVITFAVNGQGATVDDVLASAHKVIEQIC